MPTTQPVLPIAAPRRFGPSQRFELQPAERRLWVDDAAEALVAGDEP